MNTAMQQRIESGLTMAELVSGHVSEFSESVKTFGITARRTEILLSYHQREVREFQQYHESKARIAKANAEYDAKYPDESIPQDMLEMIPLWH